MIYSIQGGTTNGVLNGSASQLKQLQGTQNMASVWDTINSAVTQVSNTASAVYNVRAVLQNQKNAQMAATQRAQAAAFANAPAPAFTASYAPATTGAGAAPAKSNTMLYIGGAVALALVGFLLMRRK